MKNMNPTTYAGIYQSADTGFYHILDSKSGQLGIEQHRNIFDAQTAQRLHEISPQEYPIKVIDLDACIDALTEEVQAIDECLKAIPAPRANIIAFGTAEIMQPQIRRLGENYAEMFMDYRNVKRKFLNTTAGDGSMVGGLS